MNNPNDRTRKQPDASPARCRQLRRVVKCLAHVIYWPLRIAILTASVIGLALSAYIAAAIAWTGCVWCWNNWKPLCVWAAVILTGGLIIAAYEWARHEISKDT